ncbi:MAG TPA: hypothetical protein VH092_14765 [Urbifossiella sp.]|nr:hypothetical protein [Urbifossiella sp.]
MRIPLAALLAVVAVLAARGSAAAPQTPSAGRGGDAVRTLALNPPLWTVAAYDSLWKQWGAREKPAGYDQAVRERYGLLPSTPDGGGLPVGLVKARGPLGDGISPACVLCHTGSVAGKTYVGLGNASLDFQSLAEDLTAAAGFKVNLPFRFSYARGTVDAVSPGAFLMRFRDAELNPRAEPAEAGEMPRDVLSDPPAWWLLKKKKTRDWTGVIAAESARVDLVTLLHPFHTAEHIKRHEPVFRDIHAFVLGVPAPAYPFPINRSRAARGEGLFRDHCANCHGTYGKTWTYPNRIVPLKDLGTDPVLAAAVSDRQVDLFNSTWLAREIGPDGAPYRLTPARGYQAPPLDGVWATAPYFHNASVPTLDHVLNSKARPKVFTRSYRTAEVDYDPVRVGWKVTALDQPPGPEVPYRQRRDVYDTTRRGQGNAGHAYGDDFTEDERAAVIEYLKTL